MQSLSALAPNALTFQLESRLLELIDQDRELKAFYHDAIQAGIKTAFTDALLQTCHRVYDLIESGERSLQFCNASTDVERYQRIAPKLSELARQAFDQPGVSS